VDNVEKPFLKGQEKNKNPRVPALFIHELFLLVLIVLSVLVLVVVLLVGFVLAVFLLVFAHLFHLRGLFCPAPVKICARKY